MSRTTKALIGLAAAVLAVVGVAVASPDSQDSVQARDTGWGGTR